MLYTLAFSVLALVATAQSRFDKFEDRKGQLQIGKSGYCFGTDLHPWEGSNVFLVDCLHGHQGTVQNENMGFTHEIFWEFNAGGTKIRPQKAKDLCVDAGEVGDFNKLHLAKCDDNKATQKWWYTDDQHIALEGQEPGQCIDVQDGGRWVGVQIQTYSCTGGNDNQMWNTKFD